MTATAPNMPSRLETPKGLRLHIGLFGRRNAGKSSLINALTNQSIAIVSDIAGTTTDPVEKAAELAPIGPVVYIDTAGIDDVGELGQLRVERTLSVLGWMDIALIVCSSQQVTDYELGLMKLAAQNKTPAIVVFNKADLGAPEDFVLAIAKKHNLPYVVISAKEKEGIDALREAIIKMAQTNTEPDRPMMEGLIAPGDSVLLVTPIDTGAPKGRLIMPQVQAIREVLDSDAKCLTVRENRVAEMIADLKTPPKFVMTDSQAVQKVCEATPASIPVTTFSNTMIGFLKPGDKVMICETCSHHPQPDDIGRKKLPRWLEKTVGGALDVEVVVGKDFPSDLTPYKLILQCGGCVVTRRHMLSRVREAVRQNVAMTNYGVAISYLQGVLERALELHPAAMQAYREAQENLRVKGRIR